MNRDLSHIGNRFAHLANVCVNKDKYANQTEYILLYIFEVKIIK